jgi:L-lactate dehydrogenase
MKVGIVGTGMVGGSAAHVMVMEGVASDLVLVDPDAELASAQAEDLEDATSFGHPVRIQAGDYPALRGARVVVLSCGVRSRAGESRLALLGRNAASFRQVVPQVVAAAPEAILLVVSNPVDLLTALVCRISGLPDWRVFGTGTLLDTGRFRTRLAGLLGVSTRSVHAYVLGEHGDSEVLGWSSAAVAGVPLGAFAAQVGLELTAEVRGRVDAEVRCAAARIIAGKGATHYGIGGAVARLVRVIRDDEQAVLTVSAPGQEFCGEPGRMTCFSLPRIIGAEGVVRTLLPGLAAEEQGQLERSAAILQRAALPMLDGATGPEAAAT